MTNFINDPSATNGLEISTQHLSTNSDESDEVLIGSYILFDCKSGYTNTDGNLNVVCNTNGQWSAFPTCVPVSTTMASGMSSIFCRVEFYFSSTQVHHPWLHNQI
jgi:hypothetical protein